MKKKTYAVPSVAVRGDIVRETLGFKKTGCGENIGFFVPGGCELSFGL